MLCKSIASKKIVVRGLKGCGNGTYNNRKLEKALRQTLPLNVYFR